MKTLCMAASVLMTMAFALGAETALPQQDEGPILRPHKPAAKPAAATATLLVLCDLACNWKLDGVAQGRIEAGGSAKAKVELGQHVVSAKTEDGLDKVESDIEVKTATQAVHHVALQPVREARRKAEQEGKGKAAGAAGAWIDPATGLMWAKKDNGDNNDLTWIQADAYCKNLRLDSYSDWRLPTIDELQSIYDPSVSQPISCCSNHGGWQGDLHMKGNLQLSGWLWSGTQGNASGKAWAFVFYGGERYSSPLDYSNYRRALCVRRSGE